MESYLSVFVCVLTNNITVFLCPVPYHIIVKITKLFMTRPMSRESRIYRNIYGPSHVTGENNTKFFVARPMSRGRIIQNAL